MRLLIKIMSLFLLLSLVVFIIGGVIVYQVIKREIDVEQQRFLLERLDGVSNFIEKRNITKEFVRDKWAIIPLGTDATPTEIQFSDTVVTHATLERLEPHIKLDVVKEINGQFYKISIYDIIIEEDDIIEGLQESMIKVYLLLFGVVGLFTWLISRTVLKPFNRTLDQIKEFSIRQKTPFEPGRTNTTEFKKLNLFLKEMTEKIQHDYYSLKEFTENASHEMQTPLSIAKGKLELLMEDENITGKQQEAISNAMESLQKLTNLVRSLSLLTKIENLEFQNVESINLSDHLNKLLEQFGELITLKQLDLKLDIEDNVFIEMDPALLEVLLGNLLKNAVRHNINEGSISVQLKKDHLEIENSGNSLTVPPDQLFERFRKDNQSSDSLGLGLSIVKKICDMNDIDISYKYEKERHIITVSFNALIK